MDRDRALIDEALKQTPLPTMVNFADFAKKVAAKALELDRSGWQPTDPDVLAVREILAAYWPENHAEAAKYRAGYGDNEPDFQAALAAYKKQKGGAA